MSSMILLRKSRGHLNSHDGRKMLVLIAFCMRLPVSNFLKVCYEI
jgi:hypothetical protein